MRYREINNKGSVLRSPWASVFISSEKSKPCDFTFIYPRRTYFCDCLHAKSLYLKYTWLQSEPLPPKSHRKDKFWNLSTGMRTIMCSLKILEALDITRGSDFFYLFQLVAENCNLNSFVWVFLLILSGVFRLSVKYGLPRFLLSATITIITKSYLFSIVWEKSSASIWFVNSVR